jgi:ribosomal protein S27AE
VTLAEVNARFAEQPEMRCRRCGEWFIPDEDRNYCGRCCVEEDEKETTT